MDTFLRNLRIGLRQLWRQPAFTVTVVITLALAIAANTAIFSFVNALLIRPFPFRDPAQLIQIRTARGGELGMLSMREVLDLKSRVPSLQNIAAHTSSEGGYNFSGEGHPQEWKTILTTGNLFEVLGSPLAIGRKWPDHDDRERDYRVILSHQVWRETFAGRRDVVGKAITLDHAAGYQIDGVTSPTFDYPQGIQIYRSVGGFAQFDQRSYRNLIAVARIRRPYTVATVQAQLDAVSRNLSQEFPQTNAGLTFRAVSFRDLYSGDVRPYLLLLLGAVGFVLLIACANVMNLQLSRSLGRAREMGVRRALGASRSSLILQMLTESGMLSLASGALGIALAFLAVRVLHAIIGMGLPSWMIIDIDGPVLAFTAGIAVLTALMSGIAPALLLSQDSVIEDLKEGGRTASGGRGAATLRDAVVIAEITVAVILLTGAGLLVQNLLALENKDKGFQPDSISTFRVALGWKRYFDDASIVRYYERSQQELARTPGFEAVGFSSAPPLLKQDAFEPHTVQLEGQSLHDALANPYVRNQSISENYFRVLGIPLHAGRYFSVFDKSDSEPVVIVSARLARMLWGHENPIGRRMRHDPSAEKPNVLRKVVGVVGDIQDQELGGEPGLQFYVPYRQEADPNQYFMVKTKLGRAEVRSLTERALWSIDPQQSVFDFKPYNQRIFDTIWQLRLSRTLLALFSGVALLLAAIGIYGVTSYLVGQRRREMGIRIALGASTRNIQAIILKRALLIGAIGLAAGLAGSVILGQALKRLVPAVPSNDPISLGSPLCILLLITLAAAALPAWRASRTDPAVILRAE